METKKVTRWYWVWDYEKEELWLNAMAQEGWALQRVGFATYFFEKTEPGEYIVRLECRKKDEGYVSFVTDMGAEYIGRIAMWVYFRRKSELGEFELNSDLDSRIDQLTKIGRMLLGWVSGTCSSAYPTCATTASVSSTLSAPGFSPTPTAASRARRTSSSGSASCMNRGM